MREPETPDAVPFSPRTFSVSPGGIAYPYSDEQVPNSLKYLWPIIQNVVRSHSFSERRAIDLGCGNGVVSNKLGEMFNFAVTGIDISETGIAIAQRCYPRHAFYQLSTDDDLAGRLGTFSLILSLEVVSFVYRPQVFARRVWELLAPGGVAIISAPYHGYTKNLLISLTNQWDSHLNPFYPGTMVRFFSEKTYGRLWREAGFEDVSIRHAGRVPLIAKSMIAILKKH